MTNQSVGRGIAEKFCLLGRDEQTLADTIDNAIAEAFKAGFEHAVDGGDEAARRMPQLKNSMPLILYFLSENDRREFAQMITALKPGMIEHKIPKRVKQ